jgi:branched-chain amino acid transport system permease protein
MTDLLQHIANGVVQGLFIGMAALAITLVFGIARFPNAATGDVMTLGAYAGLVAQQITGSMALAGAAAILAGAATGLASHWLVFRRLAGRSVVSLLVASIGVAFVIRAVLGVVFGQAQEVFQVPLTRAQLYWGVRVTPLDLQISQVVVVALLAVFAVLYFTPIGRQMRAVADDRDLARVSGIRPERVMVALWLMAGAVAGLAGMMLGIKTVVEPEIGWEMLLPAFTAAILGGIGSAPGAVLAGLLLGVAQEVSTPLVGFSYKIAIAFLVMLGVLLVRPSGLFGRSESVR